MAHNYFVPELIHAVSTWKRAGHIYWEVKADQSLGFSYTRTARNLLSMKELDCDHLLRSAVKTSRKGFQTRKQLFTQTVRLSSFLSYSQSLGLVKVGSRYQISEEYLAFMINLSYRLVRDFLTHQGSSLCLSYDPIGSENLRLASSNGILSKLFNMPQRSYRFTVDQALLKL